MFEGILTSIIGGGATGLLGAIGSHVFDYFKTKELGKQQEAKFAHDQEMRKIDIEVTRLEIEGRAKIANIEADASKEVAEINVMGQSYGHDKAAYATGATAANSKWFLFVDWFRGITRPGVTWYMAGLVTWMFYAFIEALGGIKAALDATTIAEIVKQIVYTVLYVSTACTLWWFGVRPASKGNK